ncbi:MAG TPA: 23S rRNA (adenine(2030)-N(6))-methyltransferase RlmJ [Treponema sp.]|nr:23S rRNA (adenine(2030)-N(6))-methyltransferase RlmJ [Treponema sp.]
MLSYQHEYHAGNHADVIKHLTLSLILESLCKKEKPFTIIDTHSGAGIFHLDDERLLKTGEAESGIKKIMREEKENLPEALLPYVNLESGYFSKGIYAGSPEIERRYLRDGDTAHFCELHPQAYEMLEKNMAHNPKGKIILHKSDAYATLKALTPPPVKRGLILCDPSYEDASDYSAVTKALKEAHKKWNTAIIALWYPLLLRRKNETAKMISELDVAAKLGTNPSETANFTLTLFDENSVPDSLQTETGPHLYGSGMFVINPPWLLKEKMDTVKDYLKNLTAPRSTKAEVIGS